METWMVRKEQGATYNSKSLEVDHALHGHNESLRTMFGNLYSRMKLMSSSFHCQAIITFIRVTCIQVELSAVLIGK